MPCLTKYTTFRSSDNDADIVKLFAHLPLTAFDTLQEMLDCQVRTSYINSIGTIPHFGRHLPYRVITGLICNAGIGAQDVNWTEGLYGLSEGARNGCLIAYVALQELQVRIGCGCRRMRSQIMR